MRDSGDFDLTGPQITNSITAFAGGGQGSAVVLNSPINRVTTVASGGDSVKLPASIANMEVLVANSGANSLNLFPATGDQINGLGANAALAVAANKAALLYCIVAGQWVALLSA